MLDFRWVVKNRKIQPEAAFFPTKNQGLEWMNSNPRMQIAKKTAPEGAAFMGTTWLSNSRETSVADNAVSVIHPYAVHAIRSDQP